MPYFEDGESRLFFPSRPRPCNRHHPSSSLARAIIFLAPISAFDQYLEEDPKTNRIDDSLQLFTQIVSNKLLAKAALVLMLNKVRFYLSLSTLSLSNPSLLSLSLSLLPPPHTHIYIKKSAGKLTNEISFSFLVFFYIYGGSFFLGGVVDGSVEGEIESGDQSSEIVEFSFPSSFPPSLPLLHPNCLTRPTDPPTDQPLTLPPFLFFSSSTQYILLRRQTKQFRRGFRVF